MPVSFCKISSIYLNDISLHFIVPHWVKSQHVTFNSDSLLNHESGFESTLNIIVCKTNDRPTT